MTQCAPAHSLYSEMAQPSSGRSEPQNKTDESARLAWRRVLLVPCKRCGTGACWAAEARRACCAAQREAGNLSGGFALKWGVTACGQLAGRGRRWRAPARPLGRRGAARAPADASEASLETGFIAVVRGRGLVFAGRAWELRAGARRGGGDTFAGSARCRLGVRAARARSAARVHRMLLCPK